MTATQIGIRVQGPVVIDSSARLELTIVRGPPVTGSAARMRDAYVSPYTSIRSDVQLERAEVEDSMRPGASIWHLGGRLERAWSVAGRESLGTSPAAEAPRLNIGEGAEVALA